MATRVSFEPDGARYFGHDDRELLRIPAGALNTGDGPLRVGEFFIDRAPVTVAEYLRFVDDAHHPTSHRPLGSSRSPDSAIVGVSIEDAEAYARWAARRLPTALEWQRAARGRFSLAERPEVNSFGMDDFGELWEWTSTLSPTGGRLVCGGRSRDRREVRGRASNLAWEDRAADDVGFRLAANPDDDTVEVRFDTSVELAREPQTRVEGREDYGSPQLMRTVGPAVMLEPLRDGRARGVLFAADPPIHVVIEAIADPYEPREPQLLEIAVDLLHGLRSVPVANVVAAGIDPELGPVMITRQQPGVGWRDVSAALAEDDGVLPLEWALEIALYAVRCLEQLPVLPGQVPGVTPDSIHLTFAGDVQLRPRPPTLPMGGSGLPSLVEHTYNAPEVLRGQVQLPDGAASTYTAARLTLDLLCASAMARLWAAPSTDFARLQLVVDGPKPSLEEERKDAPPELVSLLAGALTRHPDQRVPRDVSTFRVALERIARGMKRVDERFASSVLAGLFGKLIENERLFAEELALLDLSGLEVTPLPAVDADGAIGRHAGWLAQRLQLPLT